MDATARTTPPIGAPAPDFSLPDTHGTPVTLSGLRGGPVVIVFVPFAFSGTCTGELCELRDNIKEFEEAGVHVLVVSCDPGHSLRAWAAQEGFGVRPALRLLAARRGGARLRRLRRRPGASRCAAASWSTPRACCGGAVVNPPGRARDFSSYRAALADLAA